MFPPTWVIAKRSTVELHAPKDMMGFEPTTTNAADLRDPCYRYFRARCTRAFLLGLARAADLWRSGRAISQCVPRNGKIHKPSYFNGLWISGCSIAVLFLSRRISDYLLISPDRLERRRPANAPIPIKSRPPIVPGSGAPETNPIDTPWTGAF